MNAEKNRLFVHVAEKIIGTDGFENMTGENLIILKKLVLLTLFLQLCGCALFPPPPAQCSGQFRPINVPVEKTDVSNKPVTDSDAGNQGGGLDKTLHNGEGVTDGK